jgi:hypothetical protein
LVTCQVNGSSSRTTDAPVVAMLCRPGTLR